MNKFDNYEDQIEDIMKTLQFLEEKGLKFSFCIDTKNNDGKLMRYSYNSRNLTLHHMCHYLLKVQNMVLQQVTLDRIIEQNIVVRYIGLSNNYLTNNKTYIVKSINVDNIGNKFLELLDTDMPKDSIGFNSDQFTHLQSFFNYN